MKTYRPVKSNRKPRYKPSHIWSNDFDKIQWKKDILVFSFFKIYLFLERGEGREKEKEGSINVWLLLTCPPWGPGPQPPHVP